MTLNKLLLGLGIMLASLTILQAQPERWQQHAVYTMEVELDPDNHQMTGNQQIVYKNNSPDTLHRIFYHLYFNAFQPGSMMDVRSRTIADPDGRVGSRINGLSPEEIGYHKVNKLEQDGQKLSYEVVGTVLEVDLAAPILPGSSTTLSMDFNSQVPVQIRRSGRDNKEGVAYSMAQWYPKLAEYDYQGWHAHPYIAREFHGIWGDFDVKITVPADYVVGATGYIQNAEEVGAGFTDKNVRSRGKTKTYHFKAPQVHDFVWAADPDYEHTMLTREDGTELHFFFQPNEKTSENWAALPAIMDQAFDYINKHYGQYPYDQYSFIQGGDGGMEYPMATLITGERTLRSLVGVSVHELMHSWYQMVLGTNESLYSWMDEGFTSYASNEVMNFLRQEGLIPGDPEEDPQLDDVRGFINFIQSGLEEPLITHSDHYTTNAAYGVGSYVKGSVFLHQLQYIMGEEVFAAGMLRYFDTWKFKHPNSNDFIRVMEKQSGLELDWFREYFVNTTHTVDYGVGSVRGGEEKISTITLEKIGVMPMPLDVVVTLTSGETQHYTIPLQIMRGEKNQEGATTYQVLPDWAWTNPTYEWQLAVPMDKIQSIDIDPSGRLVDTDRANNSWENE